MNLCINCLEELLDSENICYKCGNKDLINQQEFEKIESDLCKANKIKKLFLIKNQKYKCVNNYLDIKKRVSNIGPHTSHQSYQCPNCGRIYGADSYYCSHCNYRLIKQEDIKQVTYPELTKYKTINNNSNPTVECPYCHSTNTKKITTTSKVLNTAIWGFFGTKRFKEWHCNECGSDF